MRKIKKTLSIEELIAPTSPFYTFMSSFPNYLGINLCTLKNIQVTCEDDEFGQLTCMKINFKPTHSKKSYEGILANGGPFPWLIRKDGEIVLAE